LKTNKVWRLSNKAPECGVIGMISSDLYAR
jgi:hypothetical protein